MSEPVNVGSLVVTLVTLPPPELHVMRKQTMAFIRSNPVELVIVRKTIVADGAGGVSYTITPQAPQIFRLITQLSQGEGLSRLTDDGIETRPDFVLLGEYDANIQTHDYFMLQGRKYENVYTRTDRRYQTWSEISYRG